MNTFVRQNFPMRRIDVSILAAIVVLAAVPVGNGAAWAQTAEAPPSGLIDRLFSRERPQSADANQRLAQVSASDLLVRLDRLEAQVRQLTGAIEQLQFRNQQLEQQLKRTQEDAEFRFQEMGAKGGARPPAGQQARPTATPPAAQPLPPGPPMSPSSPPGRRSDVAEPPPSPVASARRPDVFDPALNPNAPGVPRPLGNVPGTPGPIMAEPEARADGPRDAPVGAPGGRDAGAPLDLSTLAGAVARDRPQSVPGSAPPPAAGMLPPPPPRNPNATGAQTAAVQPPTQSPRDTYDLAYGYILRKDYALAEETFREYLRRYPSDAKVPEAQYWLGESLFQRQRFRDAANAFLDVTTRYETTARAPDALLRLGQSLAAMGEREMACASLAEVARKYPRASVSVKQGVDREQKRARC
jgi:tol-pal system protein YbgF